MGRPRMISACCRSQAALLLCRSAVDGVKAARGQLLVGREGQGLSQKAIGCKDIDEKLLPACNG